MRKSSWPVTGLALAGLLRLGSPPSSAAASSVLVPDPSSQAYRYAVVAGQSADLDHDLIVTGSVRANGNIRLKAGAEIRGDATAAGSVSGGTVTGQILQGAPPLPLPVLPTVAAARSLAAQIHEQSVTFDQDVVENRIVFVNGDVRFRAAVSGGGTIIATGKITLDNVTVGHPVTFDPNSRMVLLSYSDIRIGSNRQFRGLLLASGRIEAQKGFLFAGVAVARGDVVMQKDSEITFLPPDVTPPMISDLRPADGSLVDLPSPVVSASFSDQETGVDPTATRLFLDGLERTALALVTPTDISFAPPAPLTAGQHVARLEVSDRAGNRAIANWAFSVDLEAPTVSIASPQDGALVPATSAQVTGTVQDDVGPVEVNVNGVSAAVVNGAFSVEVSLEEGYNNLVAIGTDASGKQAADSVSIVRDTALPELRIDAPQPPRITNRDVVRIAGSASDANGIATLEIAGAPVPLSADRFETTLAVAPGENRIAVAATDRAGNRSAQELVVTRFTLPEVRISAPVDLAFLGVTTVAVTGSVTGGASAVSVNGVQAVVSGETFALSGLPLVEGGNLITATATDSQGHMATATVSVVRDVTPPRVEVYVPAPGSTVMEESVAVSGLVNDIVAGTVNTSEVSVTVNGLPAIVGNRSFLAEGVPLALGDNVLVVRAVDALGNSGERAVTLRRVAPTGRRVRLVSGAAQSGMIGTALASALVVEVTDNQGVPAGTVPVIFSVRDSNGTLDGAKRRIAVVTGADGRAMAHWTLGTRVGPASQRVEAKAVGYGEPVTFTATALPGPPTLLVADSGDQQLGVAGQTLPRPLVVVATDFGYNRLEGVEVRFRVVKGSGSFENGAPEISVFTDSDGRAIVSARLDPEDGISNNVYKAWIVAAPAGPVVGFTASGWAAGAPGETAVSGVVLDNTNQPVPGVTLRVKGTAQTTESDAQGHFRLQPAPVGSFYLIADGSTADRPGSWPDLEYVVTTIPGRDNLLGMPIYLLPLDLGNGVLVTETKGGVVTLNEVPGFALEIVPGSVTFPNGSRSGHVSVTAVHSDRVPMVPNFGQQPRFIVTIQPAGARFDPPARLTLPNLEGLAPGQVTEMYSFDHDLGYFVSVGPATVSDDGLTIISNLGVGVLKAGWHCGSNPVHAGTQADCPKCKICDGFQCVGDTAKDGQSCAITAGMVCQGGQCVCAVPTHFRQTLGVANGDVLHFEYAWQSSTGRLSDLVHCSVLQRVDYNGPDPYIYPPPFDQSALNHNPTLSRRPISGSDGRAQDNHGHPNILPPYVPVSFVAQQIYYYTCVCSPGVNTLLGPISIERSITQRADGKFKYTITKTGIPATADPLP